MVALINDLRSRENRWPYKLFLAEFSWLWLSGVNALLNNFTEFIPRQSSRRNQRVSMSKTQTSFASLETSRMSPSLREGSGGEETVQKQWTAATNHVPTSWKANLLFRPCHRAILFNGGFAGLSGLSEKGRGFTHSFSLSHGVATISGRRLKPQWYRRLENLLFREVQAKRKIRTRRVNPKIGRNCAANHREDSPGFSRLLRWKRNRPSFPDTSLEGWQPAEETTQASWARRRSSLSFSHVRTREREREIDR